jgi:hypothetical protein
LSKRSISLDIPSATVQNLHYEVEWNTAGWKCECPGFFYRNRCRHLDEAARVAQTLLNNEQESSLPLTALADLMAAVEDYGRCHSKG